MNSNTHDAAPPTVALQRRKFTAQFKRDLVEQTRAPGASVSGIALANGINTNLLFAWRRRVLQSSNPTSPPVLLPVHLDLTEPEVASAPAADGQFEIAFNHVTVRLHGRVDIEALRVVLQCLTP